MIQESTPKEAFRIGILCNYGFLQKWQIACIKDIQDSGVGSIDIIYSKKNSSENGGHKSNKLKGLFYRAWVKIFPIDAISPVNIETILPNVTVKHVIPERKGKYSEVFSDADIKDVQSRNLDVLIRFGFDILKGEILTAAKHGVWSFHHGDEMHYRGGPVSFWELFHKASSNGAILQKLTEKIDAGYILKKGKFKLFAHSYAHSVNHVLYGTSSWISAVIRSIQYNDKQVSNWRLSETKAKINKVPANQQVIQFAFQQLMARISYYLKTYLFMEIWQTGFANIDNPRDLKSIKNKDITWIKNPNRNTYYADPFPSSNVDTNDLQAVYVEEYAYTSLKGKITKLSINHVGEVVSSHEVMKEQKLHASFPNHFSYQENEYLLPEISAKGGLHIFKKSGENWSELPVDFPDLPVVDPSLVYYQNRWWVFFTESKYSNESLMIFHSEHMEGPYQAHIQNPVKIDISSSRPAGKPFVVDGQLYRPAQNSTGTYGNGLQMMKIMELTPEHFDEESIDSVSGYELKGQFAGIHTWNTIDNLVLLDAKFYRFSLFHLLRMLRSKFNG